MATEVTLRPVSEDDIPFLIRLTNDPEELGEFEWYGWQNSAWYRKQFEENGYLHEKGGLLIVWAGADRVGVVSWRKVISSPVAFHWALGVAMAAHSRGKGYGTATQRSVVRYLFAHTMVNRIEAETEIGNIAEQRALEKAGFTREGVKRGVCFRNGRWHDRVEYSVLRAEVDLGEDA